MKQSLLFACLSITIICTCITRTNAQRNGLHGQVSGSNAIIPAATIQLYNDQFRKTVQTDSTGQYHLDNIPAGAYMLQVSCIGFNSRHTRVVLKKQEQQQLDLLLETAGKDLQGITVTQHIYRKEDDLIDIKKTANPTVIINKKTIRAMGSRRLDEVLREQTGMAVVSDLGAGNRSVGLQMQGFSSEYILILLNGLPMTGRFNGNFDISRIGVSDIERIEVIKGASSSLYGSEALGGVINIITKQHITAPQGMASVLYGTYNTLDATLEGETPFAKNKGAVYLSGNYYKTDGFNVNTQYLKNGQTAPPYNSYNLQGRALYRLNEVSTLNISSRMADRHSVMTRSYGAQPFTDQLDERDLNAAFSLNNNFRNGWRLLGRYYLTHYRTEQAVNIIATGKELQRNEFSQNIHRAELQAGKELLNGQLSLTSGAGGDYQNKNNTDSEGSNSMYNYFAYAQANYTPSSKYELVLGVRYDGNSVYGGKLNPSAGASYKPARWLTVKASAGKGFKAPSYAQLYQVFTNISQGYTVIGANIFTEKAAEMKETGMIQQVWANAASIRALEPETSTSLNLGVTFSFARTASLSINGFYNDIYNLINTEQVGIMRNGQQLFSYLNLNRIFTRGIETGFKYSPVEGLTLTAGYQYLEAKNKSVMNEIRDGHSQVRATGGIRTAQPGDYFGLPNRSRHMANMQVFYEYKPLGITASVRASHRGKYGFLDLDNNGYIDRYDVFVKGYTLLNAAVQKNLLKNRLTLQVSTDNISNYTDYLMPSQPGRVIMAGATWHFRKPLREQE